MLLEDGDWYWRGNEEECFDCHNLYPMCWVVICDYGIIRCLDCWQKNLKQEEEYLKNNSKI